MRNKFLISVLFVLFTQCAVAAIDENIFIQGKIGNAHDDKKVKVTDSHGQKYWLPKSAFPKKFKFEEGAIFNIEVAESVANEIFATKPPK